MSPPPHPAAPPDARAVRAAAALLPRAATVITPSPAVAALLGQAGVTATCRSLDHLEAAPGVALLADEISAAGEHADGLVAQVVRVVRPGGLVAVTVQSWLHAAVRPHTATGQPYRSDELRRLLGHHGIAVENLCAPGAAAGVAGDAEGAFDPDLDRLPGLLDSAPRLLAVGRAASSDQGRSAAFFATLPYKVVAAGVVCRDEQGQVLVVHDSFQDHWTIPGGVVDADENPREAAERETWEEAGVRVNVGRVLGVFAASWPDRVVLIYEAAPCAGVAHPHRPVHAHEIDGVAWWPLETALRRLAPHIAEQVRHCLDDPGGTLSQRLA